MDGSVTPGSGQGDAAHGYYRITEAEFLALYRAVTGRKPILRFACYLGYTLLELGLIIAAYTAAPGRQDIVASGTAFVIAFALGNLLLLADMIVAVISYRLRIRRQAAAPAQQAAPDPEYELVVSAEGFSITVLQDGAPHDELQYRWRHIDWYTMSDNLIMLRHFDTWVFLPADLADQGFDLAAFLAHFERCDDPWRRLHGLRERQPAATRHAVPSHQSATGGDQVTAAMQGAAPAMSSVRYRLPQGHLAEANAILRARSYFSHLLLLVVTGTNLAAAVAPLFGTSLGIRVLFITGFYFHALLAAGIWQKYKAAFRAPRRLVRDRMTRGGIAGAEHQIEIDDRGLRMESDSGWRRIDWDEIRWWRRIGRQRAGNLLLICNGALVFPLPRSVAASGFDYDGLVRRLAGLRPEGGPAAGLFDRHLS